MVLFDFVRGERMAKPDKENRERTYWSLDWIQKGSAGYASRKMAERFDKSKTIEMIESVLGDARSIDPERPFDRMDEDKLLRFISDSSWEKTGFLVSWILMTKSLQRAC